MDMVEKARISEAGGESRWRRDSIHGRGEMMLHQERGGVDALGSTSVS